MGWGTGRQYERSQPLTFPLCTVTPYSLPGSVAVGHSATSTERGTGQAPERLMKELCEAPQHIYSSISQSQLEVAFDMISSDYPVWQLSKRRLGEVKWLVQGRTAMESAFELRFSDPQPPSLSFCYTTNAQSMVLFSFSFISILHMSACLVSNRYLGLLTLPSVLLHLNKPKYLLYFLDYKTHPPPPSPAKFGRKMGCIL